MKFKFFIKMLKLFFNKFKRFIVDLRPLKKSDFKYCGETVFVNTGTVFANKEKISLNSNIYIGPDCRIFGSGGIDFGTGIVLGERVTIISANHNYDSPGLDMLPFDTTYIEKPVRLGDFSWVGSNVIILPGVHVGQYSVIAAGSVLTKNTEDFSIYAGNPAKRIGYRKNQDLAEIKKSWAALKAGSIYVVE